MGIATVGQALRDCLQRLGEALLRDLHVSSNDQRADSLTRWFIAEVFSSLFFLISYSLYSPSTQNELVSFNCRACLQPKVSSLS
jgi:hypothetical protein